MAGGAAFRVDLHVKILDESVVRRAKARGLDALVYAPHFTHLSTIRERAARFSDDDLLVVPGRECFTGGWRDRQHVLAVDPDEPVPDFLTLEATMAELADQDAAVLVPHPEFLTVSMDRESVEAYRDVVDAVEVYNPKHLPRHNRRASQLRRAVGLPGFASSYAHLHPTVGEVWVEFEEAMSTPGGVADALRSGAAMRLRRRSGPGHALRCRAEFAHLGWENTWTKFERVVLGGQEPTHPHHPAYGGRFDDCSVY